MVFFLQSLVSSSMLFEFQCTSSNEEHEPESPCLASNILIRRTCRISSDRKSTTKTISLSNVASIWLRFDRHIERNPCRSTDVCPTFSKFISKSHSAFFTHIFPIQKAARYRQTDRHTEREGSHNEDDE